MIRNNSISLLFAILLLVTNCQAQRFKQRAELDSVPAVGFYKMTVNPELTAIARPDLSDLRIQEPGKGFIPYIIQPQIVLPEIPINLFVGKIISNEQEKNHTIVIMDQGTEGVWNGIWFVVNINNVQRNAELSGSNDNNHWYIIDDHVLLHPTYRNISGIDTQKISFQWEKYRYYKLKIDNAHTDPLNITLAGLYKNENYSGMRTELIEVPAPAIWQKDSSNKRSYVVIRNKAPFMVKHISLEINGPLFYARKVRFYVLHTDKDSSSLSIPVDSAVFSPTSHQFSILPQKVQAIILEIDNKDDAPIKVVNASLSQDEQYIVAWLEQGKHYTLLAGSDSVLAPEYDLNQFKNCINERLPTLLYGHFSGVPAIIVAHAKPDTHGIWLWLIICISVAVMGLLTFKLMKEVKREDKAI